MYFSLKFTTEKHLFPGQNSRKMDKSQEDPIDLRRHFSDYTLTSTRLPLAERCACVSVDEMDSVGRPVTFNPEPVL